MSSSDDTTPSRDDVETPKERNVPDDRSTSGGRGGSGGRGHGRGRGQGRGGHRNNKGAGSGGAATKKKVEGGTKELGTNVFQLYSESRDRKQFERTKDAIEHYVRLNLVKGNDIVPTIRDLKVSTLELPTELSDSDKLNTAKARIFEKKIDAYVKREEQMEDNLKTLYSILWNQCSKQVKMQVKSSDKYDEKSESCDSLWLLKTIKGVCYSFQDQKNRFIAIDKAKTAIYTYSQGAETSLADYQKEFLNMVDVLEHYGGSFADDPVLIKECYISGRTKAEAIAAAREGAVAIAFLLRSSKEKYGDLLIDLENQFSLGNDQYPDTMGEAYSLLANYKPRRKHQNGRAGRIKGNLQSDQKDQAEIGVSFMMIKGTDGVLHPTVICYFCNKKGHYAGQCPSKKNTSGGDDDTTDSKVETNLTQAENNDDPPDNEEDSLGEVEEISFMQVIAKQETTDNVSCTIITKGTTESQTTSNIGSKERAEAVTCMQYSLAQTKVRSIINRNWILLDSESSISVFCNDKFLSNIRRSTKSKGVRVHSNGGYQDSIMVGDLKNFGEVWYNKESLANILSLSAVTKVCRVTMDSMHENALIVHKKDGSTMKFEAHDNGLYYYDATKTKASKATVTDYLFLNTVRNNMAMFTRRELEGAERARKLMWKIGHPSQSDFEHTLSHNLIRNCPVTLADAKRALYIWGPDLGSIKGKRVHKTPEHMPDEALVPLPMSITLHHINVTLCIDFFYVNGNPFFHSISRKIQFRTVQPVNSRSKRTILQGFDQVQRIYNARGFRITRAHGDNEFECIRLEIMPTQLHIVAPGEHVPEVERSIRTVKERTRSLTQNLPYECYPKLLIKGIVRSATFNLNAFPTRNGLSRTLSPRNIVTGLPNLDYRKIKIQPGAYAQVHIDHQPTNTQKSRTVGAIALHQANENGSWYFMSLVTGERIHSNNWVELPITDAVIDAVNGRGQEEQQPVIRDGVPIFEWRRNMPFLDDDDDESELSDNEDNEQEERFGEDPDDDENNRLGIENNADGYEEVDDNEDHQDNEDDLAHDNEDNEMPHEDEDQGVVEVTDDDDHQNGENPEQGDSDDSEDPEPRDMESSVQNVDSMRSEDTDPEDNADDSSIGPEERSVGTTEDETVDVGGYRLRGNRERSYEHRFGFLQAAVDQMESGTRIPDDTLKKCYEEVVGICFTQMTADRGIKTYGKRAVDTIFKEFAQLNDLSVFGPLDARTLTREQKRAALRAIVLIKEKRCGKIKGRTVADGRPQRQIYGKDETTSPTVSLEALLLSLLIDAKENRDVATADVGGAFLHGDMDDFVILKMTGDSVDILCKVNPSFEKNVIVENGKRVLYLQLLKALYGCVKAALIWYTLFSTVLKEMGFSLNPYDKCVANQIINGNQCTVLWYVDDNKISHIDAKVVDDILSKIEKRFGKLSITRGKKHTFLGMDIDFIGDSKVTIKMDSYIAECMEPYEVGSNEVAATPAKNDLFEIDEQSPELSKEEAETLHSIVAKLLYISNCARLDVLLPVAFLCTRVQKPTVQDKTKLRRVLLYLNGTRDIYLTLGADSLSKFNTWVDCSFAVHMDSKGHTGGGMSLGYGVILPKSGKQKLNAKSSTECELIGASDYLPNMIWARMFMDAQNVAQEEGVFHQDNTSTIKFEKNGRNSCGSKSKHIHNRYFWIKDRLQSDNIRVIHCPTRAMLADFLTKPLQGSLFKMFRDVLMGRKHFSSLLSELGLPPSKERVGNDNMLTVNQSGTEKTTGTVMKNNGKIQSGSSTNQDTEVLNVRHNGQQGNGTVREGQRANKMTYAQILVKGHTNK